MNDHYHDDPAQRCIVGCAVATPTEWAALARWGQHPEPA